MPVSATMAARITEGRKRALGKVKQEFLLKPIKPNKRATIKYNAQLQSALDKTHSSVLELYNSSADLATFDSQLDALYDDMAWWDELTTGMDSDILNFNHTHEQAFYETVTSATGINVAGFVSEQGIDKLLDDIVDANVTAITDLSNDDQSRVSELVKNALTGQQGKSSLFLEQLREVNGRSVNQAKVIARDQTQRAINTLTHFRQERSGIKKYKWVTSKDNRVRDTHVRMDGAIINWKTGIVLEAPPKRRNLVGKNVNQLTNGHIGQDYQCRCVAVPILEL